MFQEFMNYFLIVGTCAVVSSADPPDWCKLDCKDDWDHKTYKNTMCTYKPQTQAGGCKGIKAVNTDTKRKFMLHLHNQFRNEMAGGGKKDWPSAANMRQMTWDTTLETVALRWAQQCKEGHDKCRRVPKHKVVGQNYGMHGNTVAHSVGGEYDFKGWADEISKAKPSLVDNFKGGFWGHFTQLAWAESHYVGCAEIQFEQLGFFRTVLVCNYAPSGNYQNQKMYKKGDPCTKCPKGWKCIPGSPYPNLCAVPGKTAGLPVEEFKKEPPVSAGRAIVPEPRKTEEGQIESASCRSASAGTILIVFALYFGEINK